MKLLLIKHESHESLQYKTLWDITHLPLNEWYEVQSQSSSNNPIITEALKRHSTHETFYTIKTPYGSIGWIPQSFFLTEEEWRDKQIDNILC
jgi:hypothetical protein